MYQKTRRQLITFFPSVYCFLAASLGKGHLQCFVDVPRTQRKSPTFAQTVFDIFGSPKQFQHSLSLLKSQFSEELPEDCGTNPYRN